MKTLFYLLTMITLLSGGNPFSLEVHPHTRQAKLPSLALSGEAYACLAQSEAEKILGQAATLTESATEEKDGITQWKCIYTANSKDIKTGQPVKLYYILEQYDTPTLAHQAYVDILQSNASMTGQTNIKDIGDEAWLHTDRENFVLIVSRKSDHMTRIKVNKLTSLTSFDELQKVTKNLLASL